MNKIILASASPRRRELLEQIGLEFEVLPSNAEENPGSQIPHEMVTELSAVKAAEVFERISGERGDSPVVLGADTVVALGNRIMGKPGSREKAEEMLTLLQGKTHQVYTGVTLICQKEGKRTQISFYERTDVTMYPISATDIRAYVATGEPMDKAGAYGIQGRFAVFIKEIKGDYYNVVGLPIGRLYQEMKKL